MDGMAGSSMADGFAREYRFTTVQTVPVEQWIVRTVETIPARLLKGKPYGVSLGLGSRDDTIG